MGDLTSHISALLTFCPAMTQTCWGRCLYWLRGGDRYQRHQDLDDQRQPSFPDPHHMAPTVTIGRSNSGQQLGGEAIGNDVDRRSLAAARAEAREESYNQRGIGDASKSTKLAQQRQKDELLGKIRESYEGRGEDVPLHVGALSIAELKVHLDERKALG